MVSFGQNTKKYYIAFSKHNGELLHIKPFKQFTSNFYKNSVVLTNNTIFIYNITYKFICVIVYSYMRNEVFMLNKYLREQVKLLKALQGISYKEIAELMDIDK